MMRRIPQWLAWLSLALCVGFSALAVRSAGYEDLWVLRHDHGYWSVSMRSGRLYLEWSPPSSHAWPTWTPRSISVLGVEVWPVTWVLPGKPYHRRMGDLSSMEGGLMFPGTAVTFPIWYLIVLTTLWPAMLTARLIRSRRRVQAGCCRICGYDLRATPDRCPECGHAPAEVAG